MPIVNSEIGNNVKIWHKDLVNIYGSSIGDCTKVGTFVEIGNCRVGNNCNISSFTFLCEGVIIEDNVFLGPGVRTTNVKVPTASVEQKDNFLETVIEEGATVGANATIVCGITIGKYSFIAAGAVVTKNVAPYTLVMGVPAKFVRCI